MKEYRCSVKNWNKITDNLYKFCKKYGIDFKSNFSEYAAFIRTGERDPNFIYKKIKNLLKNEKNVEIKKTEDIVEKNCIVINRL